MSPNKDSIIFPNVLEICFAKVRRNISGEMMETFNIMFEISNITTDL